MPALRNLSDAELMDLLSDQTVKLTSLLTRQLANDEYRRCKLLIQALTVEIESRKNLNEDKTKREPDIFLNPD